MLLNGVNKRIRGEQSNRGEKGWPKAHLAYDMYWQPQGLPTDI